MQESSKPYLLLIIGVCSVSISSILIRLTHTSPLIIAFYRQLFCAVMVAPFLFNRPEQESVTWKDYRLLIVSGFFLALHFATWITGLTLTSIARATLFVDLQPIWAAIFGAIFLKEHLNKVEMAAIAIVTIGGIITVFPHLKDGGNSLLGDGLALTGGIVGAAYLLIGRSVRERITWLKYMYSVYYISAAWLLVANLFLLRIFPRPQQSDLIWLILMALIPGILGHGLFNAAIRYLKGYIVNAALLGEPVLATLLAYLLFSEKPDRYFYGGAALIFAGLLILFTAKQRISSPLSDE